MGTGMPAEAGAPALRRTGKKKATGGSPLVAKPRSPETADRKSRGNNETVENGESPDSTIPLADRPQSNFVHFAIFVVPTSYQVPLKGNAIKNSADIEENGNRRLLNFRDWG